jgi:hypothetical protein
VIQSQAAPEPVTIIGLAIAAAGFTTLRRRKNPA